MPTEKGDPAPSEAVGTWSSDEKGTPTLTISADGEVTGTDGCNGIGTSVKMEGDRILIEDFASTLMACNGVDDWLRGVGEVQVDGDLMTVLNSSGEKIGTLTRTAE